MDRSENGSPPEDRNSASTPAEQGAQQHVEPGYYCEDCGVEVKGHGCDMLRGQYYCRPCFRRHRMLLKLKYGAIRIFFTLFGILALCALILFILWAFEHLHS